MQSPFEDHRLHQQTLKIIDLQRQGRFLASPIEPEQDALPLPSVKELGLRHARYPYDHEADWGRFKMDYGAFALVLVEGAPPAEWADQPILQPATAVVQPDCIGLRLEDGRDPGLALDLCQEETGYRFLRRINALLRADRQPYVVWRIERADDAAVLEALSIANDSAMIFAASAVWSPDDSQLVAALAASPSKELLTAIRATLANHNSKGWITIKGRLHNAFVRGAKRGFLHASSNLARADAAGTAAVLLHPLYGNPGEEGEDHFYVVTASGEALTEKFSERLALAIPWPTQPAWADYLLRSGQEAGLVQQLPVAGPDFTAALRVVKDEAGWQAVISGGLKSGALTI